jgi:hypothetical protein
VGSDLDAMPELIRQIEIDQAVVLSEADRHLRCGPSNWARASSTLRVAFSAAGLGASQVRS